MQIKDLITWAHRNGSPDAKSSEDNPIATLQREMNHVFENFWNRVGHFEWPFGSGEAKSDVVETDKAANEIAAECDGTLVSIAHDAGALLAVDNAFATPVLQKPAALGADIVTHSGTKYLDGQGRVMAGALCGSRALITEKFAPVVRTAGMVLSPFNAWVVLKGLETLGIRVKAQCEAALAMARWLEAHPAVARVYYPGLPSHPQHDLAMRQQNGLGGGVLAFVLAGDTPEQARARAFHVIDSCRMLSIATNLGDTKTIISHPATTSHGRLTEEQRQAAGITQGVIRLAVGLEHVGDIQADLSRGLDSLQ